jgi:hypothetical protein
VAWGNDYRVRIDFSVGGTSARFRRSHFSGKAVLSVGDDRQTLQNPLKPGTHYSLSSERKWQLQVNDHQIEIVKDRPKFLSGFRPHSYTVLVDGQLVAQEKGY